MCEVFGQPPVPGWVRWMFLTFPDAGHAAASHSRLGGQTRAGFVRVRFCRSEEVLREGAPGSGK